MMQVHMTEVGRIKNLCNHNLVGIFANIQDIGPGPIIIKDLHIRALHHAQY